MSRDDAVSQKWYEVRSRMSFLKPILERAGAIHRTRKALPDLWAIRYPANRDGRYIQAHLSLGWRLEVVNRARKLLDSWQDAYRRREGGLPCREDTQRILMHEIPLLAGYAGRTRAAYRRRLRATRDNPLELLQLLVRFREEEGAFPGVKRLRQGDQP
jgi:hypothetical protein